MTSASPAPLALDSRLRLALFAGVASAQLTLLLRAGQAGFAIQAALVWIGGGLLLLEWEEEGHGTPVARLSQGRMLIAMGLLGWSLLVLSRVARLYDPLLHLVPLAALAALALLCGARPGSRVGLGLVLIGALLPAQVLINRFLPTDLLARITARAGMQLLWALGQPAYASADKILLSDRLLIVDRSCTGLDTLTLCFSALVMLTLLLPPAWVGLPPWRTLAALAALTASLAFLVNNVRVVLLGLASTTEPRHWWEHVGNFNFWHDGPGSHLFSLLAMGLVCAAYVLTLEVARRSSPAAARRR